MRNTPDFRLRYKKTAPEPNRLIVWDCVKNIEYATDRFELDNCNIRMHYGNAKSQEIKCGARMILEIYKNKYDKCAMCDKEFVTTSNFYLCRKCVTDLPDCPDCHDSLASCDDNEWRCIDGTDCMFSYNLLDIPRTKGSRK